MADGREFRIGGVFGETARVLGTRLATFLLIGLIPVAVAGFFALILRSIDRSIVCGGVENGSFGLLPTWIIGVRASAVVLFALFCRGR